MATSRSGEIRWPPVGRNDGHPWGIKWPPLGRNRWPLTAWKAPKRRARGLAGCPSLDLGGALTNDGACRFGSSVAKLDLGIWEQILRNRVVLKSSPSSRAARAAAARRRTRPSPDGCRRAASGRRCAHLLTRCHANLAGLNERPASRGLQESQRLEVGQKASPPGRVVPGEEQLGL
jgi:hypothetical protein